MSREFVETSEGVHLTSPMGDYTLCGDALEGDDTNGLEEARLTECATVTCVRCAKVIYHCRSRRVAPAVLDFVIKEAS